MTHHVIDNRKTNAIHQDTLFEKIYQSGRTDKIFADDSITETNIKFKKDGKDYLPFGTMTIVDKQAMDHYLLQRTEAETTAPSYENKSTTFDYFKQGMKDFDLPQRRSAKANYRHTLNA